jgi:hypothetical protein
MPSAEHVYNCIINNIRNLWLHSLQLHCCEFSSIGWYLVNIRVRMDVLHWLQHISAYKFNSVHKDRSFLLCLNPWNRILLKKLIVAQLVMKLNAFYCTWTFITVFTRTCYWFLSWAKWIESTSLHTVSLGPILILFPRVFLCHLSGLFLWEYPIKLMCAFVVFFMHTKCPTHLIPLDLTGLSVFGEELTL